MSALKAPDIISFKNCNLESPKATLVMNLLSYPFFEIKSPIFVFSMISFPMSSCECFFFCKVPQKYVKMDHVQFHVTNRQIVNFECYQQRLVPIHEVHDPPLKQCALPQENVQI